jgi:hypothetical protein
VPTPLASLAQSGGGCLARTAAPAARALARLRSQPPPLRLPPNICCSRPPCLGDFSRQRMPPAGGGPHSTTRRSAAERRRWAGGPRFRWFEFGCSAPATSCSVLEPPCPSHNRARHLRSSARRGCPACHHFFFTHVAYAPPLFCWALRRWSHGSPRLILAVHTRDRALPKSLPLMRADRRRPPPAAPPNTCCSRPPSRCDFPSQRVPTILLLHAPVLVGRPAERHRWAGGFLWLLLQFGSSALASKSSAREPAAPRAIVSVIRSRRAALALQPRTACPSPTSRMLRRRSAWRFASGFAARHG